MDFGQQCCLKPTCASWQAGCWCISAGISDASPAAHSRRAGPRAAWAGVANALQTRSLLFPGIDMVRALAVPVVLNIRGRCGRPCCAAITLFTALNHIWCGLAMRARQAAGECLLCDKCRSFSHSHISQFMAKLLRAQAPEKVLQSTQRARWALCSGQAMRAQRAARRVPPTRRGCRSSRASAGRLPRTRMARLWPRGLRRAWTGVSGVLAAAERGLSTGGSGGGGGEVRVQTAHVDFMLWRGSWHGRRLTRRGGFWRANDVSAKGAAEELC